MKRIIIILFVLMIFMVPATFANTASSLDEARDLTKPAGWDYGVYKYSTIDDNVYIYWSDEPINPGDSYIQTVQKYRWNEVSLNIYYDGQIESFDTSGMDSSEYINFQMVPPLTQATQGANPLQKMMSPLGSILGSVLLLIISVIAFWKGLQFLFKQLRMV